jgi:hypothetical protein
MKWLGIAFGLLGALVGAYSAWFGLTKEPNGMALGLVALALAIVAGVLPLALYRRPLMGGLLMLVSGGVGYAISIFVFPRTLYFVALGCWIVGAALLLPAGRAKNRATSIN